MTIQAVLDMKISAEEQFLFSGAMLLGALVDEYFSSEDYVVELGIFDSARQSERFKEFMSHMEGVTLDEIAEAKAKASHE